METAWKCYRNPELQDLDREISVISGLLHDIGKINSYTPDGQMTMHGRFVDHEAETLSILKPALDWLDQQDRRLGLLLRHQLTWNPRKNPIPRHIGAAWVRVADQASTASAMASC